ncbi:MAG: hypothetical protein DI598_06450 [Pseudopedobacter saltans]|uniref:Uncharacterized protein n=1 Tax=Pseudopedobacter saltans TaxID=151895 RepID=A0A2W5F3V7_9SPHI|nr:MAG: hypothetical protein DI598_06450 [Pseudopedobacter saltans]
MVVMTTLAKNPVMVYFGQEVGEKGEGKEGFGGDDGRTTLFDYWGVPAHQAWMDSGKFDGGKLTVEQQQLRVKYQRLLKAVNNVPAIQKGVCVPLAVKGLTSKQKMYARIIKNQIVLVAVNFDRNHPINQYIYLPKNWIQKYNFKSNVSNYSILGGDTIGKLQLNKPIHIQVPTTDAIVWELK